MTKIVPVDEMRETLSNVITALRDMANELEDLSNTMDSLTAEEFDNKSMAIQDKYEEKHIVIMQVERQLSKDE